MTQSPPKKRHVCRSLAAALAVAALALGKAALSPLLADTYEFIVSGYPVANERYEAYSSGTPLVAATCAIPTAAQPLEARFRTWYESDGTPLRSDRPRGIIISVF